MCKTQGISLVSVEFLLKLSLRKDSLKNDLFGKGLANCILNVSQNLIEIRF